MMAFDLSFAIQSSACSLLRLTFNTTKRFNCSSPCSVGGEAVLGKAFATGFLHVHITNEGVNILHVGSH